jgi:hypothetical protein
MVLVPLRGERGDLETLYRLDPVGAFIWSRLAGGADEEAVVRDLVAGWEVDAETARADLRRFLGELAGAGLLADADTASGTDAARGEGTREETGA